MPLPKPNEGESSEDFMQRCMADDKMNQEYPDSEQRFAVCQTQVKKDIEEGLKEFLNKLKK